MGTRSENWHRSVGALDAFVRQQQRLPSHVAPPGTPERRLARWLHYQRDRVDLTTSQLDALEHVTGWAGEDREEHWLQRLTALRMFGERHGRWPRRRATDPDERSLALWKARQQALADRGALAYVRHTHWQAFRAAERASTSEKPPTEHP